MELLKDILTEILSKETMQIQFKNLDDRILEIINGECFMLLQKIKAIIENESLSDFECIEAIVCLYEDMGSDVGNRHDFS